MPIPRPSPEELAAAAGKTVPDVIAPGLRVLFCGINPSLYTAAVGHHFARPGNRFWRALAESGFTDRLLAPDEKEALLGCGLGITNVVGRATRAASELTKEDLLAGGRALEARVRRFAPRTLCVLGVTAYRAAFERRRAGLGLQPERVADTRVWVLPNPSGLNAHFTPGDFARIFRELREFADREG